VRCPIACSSLLFLAFPLLATAGARAEDASAAVAELKAGYALKQAGNCRAALPHFLASFELKPAAKSLLNLSDCESRIGDLVSAKQHATEGRELARQGPEDAELVTVADDLLASIEKRLAHLTVKLSAETPIDCVVLRDGVAFDPATLGTPVVENPGPHKIIVRASGHDDRPYDVNLGEGQRAELLVDVGAVTPTIAPNPYGQGAVTRDEPGSSATAAPTSLWATALVVGGALSALAGGAFGIAAISNNNASNANGHCDATGCDPTGMGLRNTALSDATLSTIFFAVGLAAAGGGVALYVTAPRRATATSIEFTPVIGRASGGVGLRGTW